MNKETIISNEKATQCRIKTNVKLSADEIVKLYRKAQTADANKQIKSEDEFDELLMLSKLYYTNN